MFGLQKPSLTLRVVIGKSMGFLFGLFGLLLIPAVAPETSTMLLVAFLFYYTTLGAVIGAFGVMTVNLPIKMPMPWWFRGIWLGGWMNFIVTLFAYDELTKLMLAINGTTGLPFLSPFWLILEGVAVGFIIDWAATRWAGEGHESTAEFA